MPLGSSSIPVTQQVAREVMEAERAALGAAGEALRSEVICADAANVQELDLPRIHYVLTSPPYWDMLHARGAATQKSRRASSDLDVVYSDDSRDLGNVHDYEEFLRRLVSIYAGLQPFLARECIPHDHRQECQEGRAALPAGMGSWPRAWGSVCPQG